MAKYDWIALHHFVSTFLVNFYLIFDIKTKY